MASAEQLKALLKSHLEGDESHFFAVAMCRLPPTKRNRGMEN